MYGKPLEGEKSIWVSTMVSCAMLLLPGFHEILGVVITARIEFDDCDDVGLPTLSLLVVSIKRRA